MMFADDNSSENESMILYGKGEEEEKCHGRLPLPLADDYYNNGVQLYNSAGKDKDEGEQLLLARNEFQKALQLYLKEDTTDPERIAECFINIASILHDQEFLEDALDRYRIAIRILASTTNNRTSLLVAQAENMCGNILRRKGEVDEALKTYERALLIYEAHCPFSLYVADTKVFMAIALIESKKYCLANAHLLQSQSILSREEYEQNSIRLLNCKYYIAIIALENKRYQEALVYANFIIEHKPMYKFALLLKAKVLKRMGRIYQAQKMCERLIEIDGNHLDAHELLDGCNLLQKVYQRGNTTTA